MNKYFKAAIILAPVLLMSGCFPPGGGKALAAECQTKEMVVSKATSLYLTTFGAPPVVATIDKATAKAFDEVYSEARRVEPEKNLDQIIHFSNNKFDLIVYMYNGCATVASKIMHRDFLVWMGKINS